MLSSSSSSSHTLLLQSQGNATNNTLGKPDPYVIEAVQRGNAVVFFDVALGVVTSEDNIQAHSLSSSSSSSSSSFSMVGRIKLELFVTICPKTCENFRQFCTGEYSSGSSSTSAAVSTPMGYKYSTFHRIIKDFMIQGGDFLNHDGTGKISIYNNGLPFQDENFTMVHDRPGMLSMANSGHDSNGCQFFITTAKAEWLDGKHVVFGRVLDPESMNVVRKCENVPVKPGGKGQPRIPLTIVQCGEL